MTLPRVRATDAANMHLIGCDRPPSGYFNGLAAIFNDCERNLIRVAAVLHGPVFSYLAQVQGGVDVGVVLLSGREGGGRGCRVLAAVKNT